VKTDPLIDLEAYTAEIGKMTGWSYVVVMLPSMAVMILVLISLIKTLTHLTDLKMDDLLAEHLQEEAKNVETSESQKVESQEPELP
jgi:hypothetical protein